MSLANQLRPIQMVGSTTRGGARETSSKCDVSFTICFTDSYQLALSLQLEKVLKPRKTASARASMEEWLARAVGLLSVLSGGDTSVKASSSRNVSMEADTSTWTPPTSRTLRERKKPVFDSARAGDALPDSARRTGKNTGRSVSTSGKQSLERPPTGATSTSAPSAGVSTLEPGRGEMVSPEEVPSRGTERKKLPRVILHVRPPDN